MARSALSELQVVKQIIGVTGTALAACLAVGLSYLAFNWSKELGRPPKPRYSTQAALLGATTERAADTLRRHGHVLAAPLTCQDLPGVTPQKLRLSCNGKTTARRQVQVIATAELPQRTEYYTILVNGRPLVQNSRCLGIDCDKKRDKD